MAFYILEKKEMWLIMNETEKIYAELMFILSQVPYSYMQKVPKDMVDKMKSKMSNEWYQHFNPEIVFFKQKFQTRTLKLLEEINSRYWQ